MAGPRLMVAGSRIGAIVAVGLLIANTLLAACANGPVDHAVEIVFRKGAVVGGPGSINARQGDRVTLLIDSDADATLHAHGLPDVVTVQGGEPSRVSLVAAYVGEFDVELHPVPAADQTEQVMEQDPGDEAAPGTMIHAGPVPAPDGMGISISLTPDSVDGLNLQISTTGFEWSPAGAGGSHVAGEGHAHVYVDGVKFARAYGPWLHLSGLQVGMRRIRVTLNANTHGEYRMGELPIAAESSAVVTAAGTGGGHGAAALVVATLSVGSS